MHAAIYARKSTEQEKGESGDSISIERQIENARAFAQEKGWTVVDAHVYRDEAISGAVFDRPGLTALLEAAQRREFGVLITMDETRLGREQWDTGNVLKALSTAKVGIWYYRTKRQPDLSTAVGKFMEGVTSFASEAYRESIAGWTRDGLAKHAREGHVTGTAPFGYRIAKLHPEREKSPKVLVIEPAQAEIVRGIFERYAQGYGIVRLAHELNANPETQRLRKWSPPSVRQILTNEVYVGRIVFGKTRVEVVNSKYVRTQLPESKWVRAERPELRILSDQLWNEAHARHQDRKATYLRANNGQLQGRPDGESQHLLAGFVVCDECGGKLIVRSTAKKETLYRYLVCYRYWASRKCSNGRNVRLDWLTDQVVTTLKRYVTPESAAKAARELAEEADSSPERVAAKREQLKDEIAKCEKRVTQAVEALIAAPASKALADALKAAEAQQEELVARLRSLDATQAVVVRWSAADHEERVATLLADWQAALEGEPALGRQVLRKLLVMPIIVRPEAEGRGIAWATAGTFGSILGAVGTGDDAVVTRRTGESRAELSAELKELVRQGEGRGGPTS